MNSNKRIAVLGLDGLSYNYLNKILNKINLPTLKNLIYKSDLKVDLYCFPPVTPVSWPSIMTGVNPGKHGIYGFTKYENESIRLFTTLDLGHPRIHEMLAFNKTFKSLIIDPIPSYPLIPVSNTHIFTISFFTPKPIVYPISIKKYIEGLKPIDYSSIDSYLNGLYHYLEKYLIILEELDSREYYNLVWININFPDNMFHIASRIKEFSILENKILPSEKRIWFFIDKILNYMNKAFDNIVIVSDHGFRVYDKMIAINTILYRLGYIKTTSKGISEKVKHLRKYHVVEDTRGNKYVTLNANLIKILKHPLLRPFTRILRQIYKKVTKKELIVLYPDVDEKLSKAFMHEVYTFGIITKNLNEKNITKIKQELSKYKGIRYVKEREALFRGPYIYSFPKLYVHLDFDHGYWIARTKVFDKIYIHERVLQHYPFGVFIMKDLNGFKIRDQVLNNTAVASLIMAWLGVPLSSWIDDKDLVEKIFGKVNYTNEYVKRWELVKRLYIASSRMRTR